jgi:polysaccharide export outer membrane protein
MGSTIGARVPDPPADSYTVGPGDGLQVSIFAGGEKQEDFSVTITEAGMITCPLIGDLPVAGLTVPEVARRMKQKLDGDYYVHPDVIVQVTEYAGKIYVLGEVRHPGVYPIRQGLTALTACGLAGGFTDFAAPGRARLVRLREGKSSRLMIDLNRIGKGRGEDVVLLTGDRLEIPQRWF